MGLTKYATMTTSPANSTQTLHHRSYQSRVPSGRLFWVAILVGFGGSFHFGFQLTVTNPSHATFLRFVNGSFRRHYGQHLTSSKLEAVWSLIVATIFFGAIAGCISMRYLADKIGRKKGIILAYSLTAVFLLLSVISKFLNSFELFTLARFGLGFSLALSLGIAAIFLTECSPKRSRGSIGMTTGILLQLGTVIGSVMGMPVVLGGHHVWWVIFAIEFGALAFVHTIMPFLHDSPGYLLILGKEKRARNSLKFYYNLDEDKPELIENLMDELRENMLQNTKSSIGMTEMISRGGMDLRGMIVGCVLAISVAFGGIAVINAFAVELFLNTGLAPMEASLANVGLSIISLISNLVSATMIDRFGRRRLILFTTGSILALNIVISALMFVYEHLAYSWTGPTLIAAISMWIVAFAFGPGPLCYFISSEMVSQNVRSAAQSWVTLTQMAGRGAVLTFYLPLRNVVGNGEAYLLLFVAPIMLSLIYLYFHLPETKNRNLQEVHREIKALPKFPCCSPSIGESSPYKHSQTVAV